MDPKRMMAARQELASNPKGSLISTAFEDGCKISREGKVICKAGRKVLKEEGNALQHASKLDLPVPKVHNVSLTEDGICSIRMDYVDGECLEDAWPRMSADERRSIAQQLHRILSAMRASSPPEPTAIGSCGGPARDCRAMNDYTGGPFANEPDFNNFILNLGKKTPQSIRSLLTDSLQAQEGHRIVFTHADLSPRNIIICDGQIQALLDWEYAGWYPEYWEYVKFFSCPTGCDGWYDLAPEIFEERYPSELLLYQAIARWQRP